MKAISMLIIVSVCFSIVGCSQPIAAIQGSLYSFVKEEKTSKSGFMGEKRSITIKDFRGNDAYVEDISSLKEEAEKYILGHQDLSESVKNSLRELKVAPGLTTQEVTLLLGKPDKVMRTTGARYNSSKIWIYRVSKIRAFTVFILPVFFVHEGYYLYFKDGMLDKIERRSLKQIVRQGAGPGVIQAK